MRSVTGIEFGAESFVLARVRSGEDGAVVSAVHGVDADDRPGPRETLGRYLASVRRRKRFPRHAHVVAWGLHPGPSAQDPVTQAAMGPLREAGFVIDEVLTPSEALALVARQRPSMAGRGAAAWVAVNRGGAAIGIVHRGELLYARELNWNYRPGSTTREELLQRYSLVAHLAPELRHGFDVVQQEYGATVDAVVTCGDLPDLRSLTMPLTEELDIEVETLDTPESLSLEGAAAADVGERSAALRLACAAAVAGAPARSAATFAPRVGAAAAAAALVVLAIWGAVSLRSGSGRQPSPVAAAPPSAESRATPAGQKDRGRGNQAVSSTPPASPPRSTAPAAETARPAATTGRQETVGTTAEASRQDSAAVSKSESPAAEPSRDAAGRAAPTATPRRIAPGRNANAEQDASQRPVRPAPAPLSDPLPTVNSILVAPDRRLAVVDGAIVREGDAIGRRVVARIEAGAVILREPSGLEISVPIRRRVGSGGSEEGM